MRVQVLQGVLFVGAVMAVAALPPMQSAAARGAAQQAGQAPAGRGAPAVNDSRTSKEELERWMKELSNWGRWGKDGGCWKLGITVFKNGIVTRGILLDIPRLKGVPYLEAGTHVYREDVEAWEKKAGIKIGPGDAVFLRTGRWARR